MHNLQLPVDKAAEDDAIAIACTSTPGRIDLLAELLPADFTGERQKIWEAVAVLHDGGDAVTTDTVAHEVGWERRKMRQLVLDASPLSAPNTIKRITDASGRRSAMFAAETLLTNAADRELSLADSLDLAQSLLAEAVPSLTKPVPDYDEWAANVSMEYDWVIPSLIERKERVIVVASEGIGKSFFLRQVAMMASAGIQFRTERRIEPIRSLVVDAENSDRQIVRNAEQMRSMCVKHGSWNSSLFGVVPTSHIDLHKRKDRSEIEGYLRSFRPDLLVIGPLYKIFARGNRDYDVAASLACEILDDWRNRFGVAMMIEHHAPKGLGGKRDLDPFGSSVWLRWPEVGLTISRDQNDPTGRMFELGRFRPDREPREWPSTIMRGRRDAWPWHTLPDDEQKNPARRDQNDSF